MMLRPQMIARLRFSSHRTAQNPSTNDSPYYESLRRKIRSLALTTAGFKASGQGLVRREGLQLRKRPAVQMSEHPAPGPISDARQILKDDSLPVCFRLGHNLLGDAVVRVPDKSMLPSRDT